MTAWRSFVRLDCEWLAITQAIGKGEAGVRALFEGFVEKRRRLRAEMVFLQEEIDFTTYVMFGLSDTTLLFDFWELAPFELDAGMRPFEILQQRNLDDFPVPSEIPPGWPREVKELWRRRMDAIRGSKDLALIEDDHYKRRWIGRQGLFNHTAWQDQFKEASGKWLLDRLESQQYWPIEQREPFLQSTARLADKASGDHEFLQVAAFYRGRPDFDVAAFVTELVESESSPFPSCGTSPRACASGRSGNAPGTSSGTGRREGRGEIPVPPKYATADFLKSDYWRLRGKLDVPKERWISYPHCSRPRATRRWSSAGPAGTTSSRRRPWSPTTTPASGRAGTPAPEPLLAGLDQLLPWIHQWHPEIDPEFGDTAGQSYQTHPGNDAHELGPDAGRYPQLAAAGQATTRRRARKRRWTSSSANCSTCRSGSARATSSSTCPRASPSRRRRSSSTSSRPNWSTASTTPWASSARRSMRRAARRATCTAASAAASRTSWRCCTCCLQHNPAVRSITELARSVAKHGWVEDKKFLLVPYHMIGARNMESAILGGYVDHVMQLHPTPRCRASTWPTRSSRTPCSTGKCSATRSSSTN